MDIPKPFYLPHTDIRARLCATQAPYLQTLISQKETISKLNSTRHFIRDSSYGFDSTQYVDTLGTIRQETLDVIGAQRQTKTESFQEFLQQTDFSWQFYRNLFLLLDILLIVYRLCNLYLSVKLLCSGEEQKVVATAAAADVPVAYKHVKSYSSLNSEEHLMLQKDCDVSALTNDTLLLSQNDDSILSSQASSKTTRQQNGSALGAGLEHSSIDAKSCDTQSSSVRKQRGGGGARKQTVTCCARMCSTLNRCAVTLLRSNLWTCALFLSVIFFGCNMLLVHVNHSSLTGCFIVTHFSKQLYASIDTHAHTTNFYVNFQQDAVNHNIRQQYSAFNAPILRELQGLVQYFSSCKCHSFLSFHCSLRTPMPNAQKNRALKRFSHIYILKILTMFFNVTVQDVTTDSYYNESCAIQDSFTQDFICNVTSRENLLKTPVLPCNTAPYRAINYTCECRFVSYLVN